MKPVHLLATLLGITMLALAGCNTVRGAGQDIEAAGQEIEEEANENSY